MLESSLESLLPDGLADETLTSLALLFPFSSSSTVPSWLRKSVASDPEHDSFLHAIRTGPLEPRERDIRNFHYWHDRIVVLKEAFDEAPGTNSLAQFWHDRRNSRQWYTLWVALLSVMLSVSLGVAQVVLSSIQLRNYTHASTVAADGPSFTESPSKASTSPPASTNPKVEGTNDHNISPWAIAGITIGGVTLFITVLGSLFLLRRCERQRKICKAYYRYACGDART